MSATVKARSSTPRRPALGRFLRRQDGTASVEAVLWMPIFVALFGFIVDTSLIFYGQSKVLRVLQDGNRNLSIGRLADEASTETYITNELAALNVTANVKSKITAGVVRTDVTFPAAQLQALGFFTALLGLTISISAEHMIENWEA
jgi:Flp pilus assembly protein TadG